MSNPRALWRSLRVVEHLIAALAIALAIAAGQRVGLQCRWVPGIARWWHGRLCRAMGLHLEVAGELAPSALLVANHISWLDIPVLGSRAKIDFLSKAEVRDWPLIGWMAEIVGTLFIFRGGNETGTLIPRIAERVRAGGKVAVFPEGTTTDGTRLQRFHPRLLGAGQLDKVPIQPVALRYGTNAAPDPLAPFVDDDALVPHLARLVRHPGLRVQIRFLPPLDGHALSRRQIAEHCRRAIGKSLDMETSDMLSHPACRGAPQSGSLSTSLVEAA